MSIPTLYEIADGLAPAGSTVWDTHFLPVPKPRLLRGAARMNRGHLLCDGREIDPKHLYATEAAARAELIKRHLAAIARAEKDLAYARKAIEKMTAAEVAPEKSEVTP